MSGPRSCPSSAGGEGPLNTVRGWAPLPPVAHISTSIGRVLNSSGSRAPRSPVQSTPFPLTLRSHCPTVTPFFSASPFTVLILQVFGPPSDPTPRPVGPSCVKVKVLQFGSGHISTSIGRVLNSSGSSVSKLSLVQSTSFPLTLRSHCPTVTPFALAAPAVVSILHAWGFAFCTPSPMGPCSVKEKVLQCPPNTWLISSSNMTELRLAAVWPLPDPPGTDLDRARGS